MGTRIIVVTKTLNEASNIDNFCNNFDFADKILIADGGSSDDTIERALQYSNVEVREFEQRILTPIGFMNPEPQHLNFIIDWAKNEGADWIILDGCDTWPNAALRQDARRILDETTEQAIHLHRLYIWGQDEYFPKMNVSPALWAWQPKMVDIYCEERTNTCFDSQMMGIDLDKARVLERPYCCLHYVYPDEATVKKKMERYAAWGHPQDHPLESIYAPPEPLPDWAI